MLKTIPLRRLYFSRFVKLLVFVVMALAVIGVSTAIVSMLFGKPIGDDYGAIDTFKPGNRLEESIYSLTTTGRYGQSIASSVLYGSLGDRIVVLLPLAILAWFIVLAFMYIKYFLRSVVKKQETLLFISASAAILLTFLTLLVNNTHQTTNLHAWASYQLFFWPSGIITYTLPLLLFVTGFYTIFLSKKGVTLRFRTQLIAYIILTFVSSLFNEVQPIILLLTAAGLLLASYLKYFKQIRSHRRVLLATIPTTIVAVLALYFSPGRIQRSQVIGAITPSTDGSLAGSVMRNMTTLFESLYFRPREILLLALVGALIAVIVYAYTKNIKVYTKRTMVALPYVALVVLVFAASIVVSITLTVIGYGYSTGVFSRTMLIAQFLYVITVPLIAFCISTIILSREKLKLWFSIGVVLLGFLFLTSLPKYTSKILTQVNSSVTYFNVWNEQDAILRSKAADGVETTVYLDNPAVGVGDGFSLTCVGKYASSTMWLNNQISQYYGGHDKICAKEPITKQP